MTWQAPNESTLVSKAEAKRKILELASDEGMKGAFKVFYDNQVISTPDDLPDSVDMSKVRVSEVLDQARVGWYARFLGWVVR